MSRPLVLAAVGSLVVPAAVGAVIKSTGPAAASASSHREAPLIAEDPSADLTDSTRSAARTSPTPSRFSRTSCRARIRRPARTGTRSRRTRGTTSRSTRTATSRPNVIYRFQFQHEDGAVLPRRHRTAVHGYARRGWQDDGRAHVAPRRRTTSGLARPRATARSPRRAIVSVAGGGRRSPVSVTTRSSATSARSSISSRSARARATRAAARTSSPAMASTRSAYRCRSRA